MYLKHKYKAKTFSLNDLISEFLTYTYHINKQVKTNQHPRLKYSVTLRERKIVFVLWMKHKQSTWAQGAKDLFEADKKQFKS